MIRTWAANQSASSPDGLAVKHFRRFINIEAQGYATGGTRTFHTRVLRLSDQANAEETINGLTQHPKDGHKPLLNLFPGFERITSALFTVHTEWTAALPCGGQMLVRETGRPRRVVPDRKKPTAQGTT